MAYGSYKNSIYFDLGNGIHIEDDMLITDDSFQRWQDSLIVFENNIFRDVSSNYIPGRILRFDTNILTPDPYYVK